MAVPVFLVRSLMAIGFVRWLSRHPLLAALLTLFSFVWIKWMALPPDWYLIHTFPSNKETLERLVTMLKEDIASYSSIILDPHERCCVVRLDDFKEIKRSMTSEQIPERRVQAYGRLMRKAGVYDVGLLRNGFSQVRVKIDYYFVGGSVSYLYSEEPMADCAQKLYDITEGMPAYDCTQLDKHWYLFHI
ncbi:hypothetical protein Mmc1_3397 [Magnetococcus marinus MC-1]|uniref:Uncharacterized protein n=2 Tax=Magnetococcus TaxID=162171 RepID=A0LD40_MAGMM|nr:hypothetical protein Mmc1_3397 [Magnetococcus marinus MC-1]